MEEDDVVLVHCEACGGWVALGTCACLFPPPAAPPVPGLYGPDNPVGIKMPDLFSCCLGPSTQGRLEELLATGVNVEQRGCIGEGSYGRWYTPLLMAAIQGRVYVVQLLLDYNADVHAHGRTILHKVARTGVRDRSAVVKLLLDHGADVHATDSTGPFVGLTPLHEAAEGGDPDLVQVLIHHGVNTAALTPSGHNAEFLATNKGHLAVVEMIQAETLPRAKGVAFAMGLHERLGEASRVSLLDKEVVRIVLELFLNP